MELELRQLPLAQAAGGSQSDWIQTECRMASGTRGYNCLPTGLATSRAQRVSWAFGTTPSKNGFTYLLPPETLFPTSLFLGAQFPSDYTELSLVRALQCVKPF